VSQVKIVDAWMNPNILAPSGRPEHFERIEYLFGGTTSLRARGTTTEQYIEEMDRAGIERGVLTATVENPEGYNDWVFEMCENHPDRFVPALYVDPTHGMDSIRAVEAMHRDHDIRLVKVLGFKTQLPYDHPYYFPLYAKCIELDVPISVNVGIPGPAVPGRCQDPMALDEVCYFFPELKVIMAHGGEPWDALCVKLMLKWRHLYYMTSAFAPKHIPGSVLHYLNTRGADKVMFASDYPILSFDRCREEVDRMEFRDDSVREKFLRGNALRVIYGESDGNH